MNALTAISTFAGEHSPAILVTAGLVGMGVTIYLACKATSKMPDILKEAEEEEEEIRNRKVEDTDGEDTGYSEEDREKDLKDHTVKVRLRIVKNYLPAVATGVASTAAILCGFNILNGRYLLVTSAYATLENTHSKYCERIKERYGEEADRYGNTGIWEDEVNVVDLETGEERKEKVTTSDVEPVEKVNGHVHLLGPGDYLYDRCGGDKKLIKSQLQVFQADADRRYQRGDYVNENEVLANIYTTDSCHMTDVGQISGWCNRDKESEEGRGHFVDFGCWDYSRSKSNPDLITAPGTTMDGEDCEYIVLNLNARQVSFANINKIKAAPRDKVRVRRGGKYISKEGV